MKRLPRLAKTVIGLLVAGLLIILMFRWLERSLVYHPGRVLTVTGAELHRPFEDVRFRTRDGLELNGWFYPADPHSGRAHLVVLYCHGNAGNIGNRLEVYEALLTAGVGVFTFDYRGYGRSQGRPSEEGTYRDAQAACEWLAQRGFARSRIIAYGYSLGGGVAAELAVREPVGGLVLQSTFTSIPAIGTELYPWLPARWINTIRYDTRAKLPGLRLPVLIMHSPHDDLIGFHHAQTNFAAANEPKLFQEISGDHNSPLANRAQYLAGLENFLRQFEAPAPAR